MVVGEWVQRALVVQPEGTVVLQTLLVSFKIILSKDKIIKQFVSLSKPGYKSRYW